MCNEDIKKPASGDAGFLLLFIGFDFDAEH